ncbi:GTP-binding protein [Streptomyces sp. NPDC002793]|uniref:GTP-binding protein n=1 Tax=Streptomyces sp. NPDC002793 TaxID=3154432 RepID=UPI00332A45BA
MQVFAKPGPDELVEIGDLLIEEHHLHRERVHHLGGQLPPGRLACRRTRSGAISLGDHYAAAPILDVIDPAPFMADIGCVHQTVRLWNGWDRTAPLTRAEAAARQVEAADVLYVPAEKDADSRYASGVASLVEQINGTPPLLHPSADEKRFVHPLPADFREQWLARLDPMVTPGIRRGSAHLTPSVAFVLWRARPPAHPQRLAGALANVMRRVVRSRGHLRLSSRPDFCGHLALRRLRT